jgi:hypothetical protein
MGLVGRNSRDARWVEWDRKKLKFTVETWVMLFLYIICFSELVPTEKEYLTGVF